jgi:hypothetical protein
VVTDSHSFSKTSALMRSLVSGRPTRCLEGYGTTFGFSLGEDGSKKTGSYGCPRNTISVDHRCRRFLIESFLSSGYPPALDVEDAAWWGRISRRLIFHGRFANALLAFAPTRSGRTRSSGTATYPRFSSQRSPIANCLRSFLSWPTGSLRARPRASAACLLRGEIECFFMALPPARNFVVNSR